MHIHNNVFLILALPMATLSAQEVHFGAQIGASFPLADLQNRVGNQIGYTAGVSLALELQGGHVLRPRVDYTLHESAAYSDFAFDNEKTKNTTLFIGADYNYFLSGKPSHGIYLLLGWGYAKTKVSYDSWIQRDSYSAFAYAIGLGFQFTSMIGAEARYNSTHPETYGTYKNESVNTAITFRF